MRNFVVFICFMAIVVMNFALRGRQVDSPNTNAYKYVTWSDNIHNEENEEYLWETVANMDSITTELYFLGELDTCYVQFLFCDRYYETLTAVSKAWYNKAYEIYGFND